MRFNRQALAGLVLFIAALVLLRQGIAVVTGEIPLLQRQVELMQQQDIEPAALFYTDSRTALLAIDRVEQKLKPR